MKLEDVEFILNRSSWFKLEDYVADYGLRRPEDHQGIDKMLYEGGKLLIAHRLSSFDEVILEVYREHDLTDLSRLDKPVGECIALDPKARWELALYLLSTVCPMGN